METFWQQLWHQVPNNRLKPQIGQVIDWVLPVRCASCGEIVGAGGAVCGRCWSKLTFLSEPCCRCCGLPFEYQDADVGQGLCAICYAKPPHYSHVRSCLAYDEASRGMVLSFKNGDRLDLTNAFVQWLQRAGHELLETADVIVPVPLNRWRLLKRRYNQAAELARNLAQVSGKNFQPHWLTRPRPGGSQEGKNFSQRHDQVRKAFVVPDQHAQSLAGKTILVIDDVFTTGATLDAVARCLIKAGAANVMGLTVARVVRSTDPTQLD